MAGRRRLANFSTWLVLLAMPLLAACGSAGLGATSSSDAAAWPDVATIPQADAGSDASADAGGQARPPWQVQGRVATLQLPLQTSEAQGATPDWLVQPPPGTRALWAQLDGPPGLQLAVWRWQDGAGKLLTVPSWLQGPVAPWLCTSGCLFRQASRPQQQVAYAGQTPAVADLQGPHKIAGFAWKPPAAQPVPATLSLRAVAVTGPALNHGTLQVNLCLTGAFGLTAALAAQYPRITDAIAQLQEIYAQVGIDVVVTLRDVQGASPLITHDDADDELSALFATGANLPMAINVFLVEQVSRGEAMTPILGIAGGIPGPPLQVGTAQAGVAISLALGPGEPDRLGVAIAHEIGHFLGLFHSTEYAPAGQAPLHDQLTDTGEQDAGNLMYWSPQPESRALSAQQGQILRDSPWLQP